MSKPPLSFEKRLAKAKTKLIMRYPFIGSIALGFTYQIVDNTNNHGIPTAAVNGRDKLIIINSDYFKDKSDDNLLFAVAHECLHPMFEHHIRFGNRNPILWNFAGDYAINYFLKKEGIGVIHPNWLDSKKIYKRGGKTTEGIYAYLLKNAINLPQIGVSDIDNQEQGGGQSGQADGKGKSKSKGKGDGEVKIEGETVDTVIPFNGTESERNEQASNWRQAVARAVQSAKMMGNCSANVKRLAGELLEPVVDWRYVLLQFVEKCKNEDRSWARVNRRFIAQGLNLPGSSGEKMGPIAIALDMSGSISDDAMNQFIAELREIKETYNPKQIDVIYFDSEVCRNDVIDEHEELDISPAGGGGTAFSPIFKHIFNSDVDPVLCVVLTDLECNDFGPAPDYPVLWVSTEKGKAPFGEVVEMQL